MEDKKYEHFHNLVTDMVGMLSTLFIINGLQQKETTMEEVMSNSGIYLMFETYGEETSKKIINLAIQAINELHILGQGVIVVLKDGLFTFEVTTEEPKLEGMN